MSSIDSTVCVQGGCHAAEASARIDTVKPVKEVITDDGFEMAVSDIVFEEIFGPISGSHR